MNAAAVLLLAVALHAGPASCAANYSARTDVVNGIEVVRLTDAARRVEVSVIPSIGNLVYEMKVGGRNVLWFPYSNLADFKAEPKFCGIPFLAPWANRLRQDAYSVNGRKYLLNGDLDNLQRDTNGKPLHGLLAFSPHWRIKDLDAGARDARLTSRLEFWRYPELMAQFPFAHTIEMTHRVRNGALEVETVLENHSSEPLPVVIGHHPYLHIPGVHRASWRANLPARERFVLADDFLPTGERQAVVTTGLRPFPGLPRGEAYTGLVRGPDGNCAFVVEGGGVRLSVILGPLYKVALVYAPRGSDFVCFEPMAAPGDALNLAHEGKYKDLQNVPPGGRWRECFRVTATGL
jgi:aldose 1-epimerase